MLPGSRAHRRHDIIPYQRARRSQDKRDIPDSGGARGESVLLLSVDSLSTSDVSNSLMAPS